MYVYMLHMCIYKYRYSIQSLPTESKNETCGLLGVKDIKEGFDYSRPQLDEQKYQQCFRQELGKRLG